MRQKHMTKGKNYRISSKNGKHFWSIYDGSL